MTTTVTGSSILTPDEINTYLLDPFEAEALATQVATVVRTDSHSYRIPVPGSEPSADWVAEGEEVVLSDMTFDEVTVTPTKVMGVVPITRELSEDSGPDAADVIGNGLARDIARKVDAAFFGNLANPNAQKGLGSLAVNANADDVQGLTVTAFDSLDVFAEAQSLAEGVGAAITSFVANPADALTLALLKESTGSNRPLLGADPTQPTRRLIGGVPLLRSSAVPAGTIWGIPRERVVVVIRKDVTMETDKSVFFTSDRIAVKAVMRVGFGYPQPSALVKITTTV
ncbi:phage major capsid protein [Blastococcus sp. CT_GayMR19]|uniref:phage major capsid protein n=1 Tax=Blastococcus sp. CT_GayMR19 TaxID=2559608 RepID=UPI001073D405|nr:phage major capsid protein [Blastococcus sp. CT_GayMR19]TFV78375.1 phage major capsid protein [Blastococcus sp. CT_GayMR19]